MGAYKDGKKWLVKKSYIDRFGKQKYLTKRGFATKREALDYERSFLEKISGTTEMSFKDFVEVYKNDRAPRIKESTTVTKYNIIDKHILPYFDKKKLCDITSADVLAWQNEIIKTKDPKTGKAYSKSYLKTVHNQLSAMFNHAVKYYGLASNPARIAGNMGSEKEIRTNFWTKEEYLKFAKVMMDKPLAYYCFEVLYWCGIREGELLALTREDVDLEAGTISITKTYQHINGDDTITTPKTVQSYRIVKMPVFLIDEIKDYISMIYDLQPGERLFSTQKHSLSRWLKQGAEKAGVKKIRVHDLRHSHVSLLINLGYSAVAIANRVGHKSVEMTYRYAHMFESEQNTMVKDLEIAGGDRNVG